ncbi:hypothetical protein [Austwickia chelonae]|uniref:hypothetical protein n=1 Tax=Austwickia chelonae TaxID=100225 RepID=UPI0013C3591F|nr:hypothetical protein [Austwickia chelonae]
MVHPARGQLRLTRLGVFVASCVLLGAFGHAHGGGHAPAPATLVLAVVPLTLTGLWFTKAERGVFSLFTALSLVQSALHLFLHLSHAHTPARALSGPSHHLHPPRPNGPLHSDHEQVVTAAASSIEIAQLLPSAQMLYAHLLAIAVTAALLGWGERSLWAAARRLLRPFPRLITPTIPSQTLAPCVQVLVHLGRDVLAMAPVRGPPKGFRTNLPVAIPF